MLTFPKKNFQEYFLKVDISILIDLPLKSVCPSWWPTRIRLNNWTALTMANWLKQVNTLIWGLISKTSDNLHTTFWNVFSCNTSFDLHFQTAHDDVIQWKHFPCYWPFVRGIHRSPVNSLHKGHWHRALTFSLICDWTNGWVNTKMPVIWDAIVPTMTSL